MNTFRHFFLLIVLLATASTNANAAKILFLTNVSTPVSVNDLSIIGSLTDLGHTVVSKRSQDFTTADLPGTDCIFISEAIGSADPASLYTAENANLIQIPIISCEPYAYSTGRLPMMELTNSGAPPTGYGAGTTIYGKIWITAAGAQHPIGQKAGFTTPITTNEDAIEVLNNTPGMALVNATTIPEGKGVVVANTGQSHQAVIVAIEKGTVVVPGKPLQARRVHFFPRGGTLTDNGKALLRATVEWCVEDITTSIKDASETALKIFVADNRIHINNANARLDIFRIDGQLNSSHFNQPVVDCTTMPKGVYIAKATVGTQSSTLKVIVR